ncbi:Unknown protein, partial [Striga hermonthica]
MISTKLDESNYLIWKQQVIKAIRGYGVEGYINGETKKPEKLISDSKNGESQINPDYLYWVRQDQLLASWLMSSLSEGILVMMVGLNTAQEIWETIESNFASQSSARIMQYKLKLQTLKKAGLTMREFLNRIKNHCDVLAIAGEKVSEQNQILHILTGLGSEYDSVVVNVTSRFPPHTLAEVHALLLTYESRLEMNQGSVVNSEGSQPYANVVTQNSQRTFNQGFNQFKGNRNAHQGGSRGRGSYRGRGRGRNQGNRPQCQICHGLNHTADKCWYRYDAQPNQQATGQGQQTPRRNPTLNMVHMPGGNTYSDIGSETNLYPDSRASNHVTNELENLNIASEYNGGSKLLMGNGEGAAISHFGNSLIQHPGHSNVFILRNLLHVPMISRNLLSVSQFAKDNKVLELWHQRLGHANYDNVKRALRLCNLNYESDGENNICGSCIMAKSHCLPFDHSQHKSFYPLEFIHSDVWGPCHVKSLNGYAYYVSFIDDYSRFIWIYLLKAKSDVHSAFVNFKALVENQLGKKIKSFQSDGGGEYQALSKLFQENGIMHRVSCAYTPQQNGLAERKHRDIVNMGLSLLAQSHLPLCYWGDAFITSTYLLNRIPTRPLNFKIPLDILYGVKPDYKRLKVFGCLCYPHLRPYNKHKMDYRSCAGVFLGYSNQYKGYKVLLPNRRVIITRDVVFDEKRFPYAEKKATDNVGANLER